MSRTHKVLIPFSVFSFTLLALIPYCTSIDETSVTFTRFINDSQTITSGGKIFKLGFFSPGKSSNRYVGIWYNTISVQTVVWVANKDTPLKNSFGSLKIANDGNLVVLDGKGTILWSSNVSNIAVNDSMAELLDNGNLVLRQVGEDRRTLWESFDDPSNTFLPSMKIGMNKKTGKTNMLNSWKSDSDPSNGNFLIGLEVIDIPQVVIWNGTQRHRRSGPWNNQIFIGVPNMFSVYLDGFHVDNDPVKDTIYMTYNYVNKSSFKRYILDHSGELFGERWDEGNSGWIRIFSSTTNGKCDDYSKCGSFGSCNILDSPICTCLRGFRAKNQDEWSKGNWSSGCIRNIELKCERNKNGSTDVSDEKDDAFFKLEMMQVPDFAYRKVGPKNLKECEQQCLTNCSCSAYSFDGGVGCMIWIQNLLDIQKYSKGTGVDLYIRVAHSELDQKKKLKVIIITVTVLIGTFIIGVSTYFWWRSKTNRKGKGKKKIRVSLVDTNGNVGNVSSDSNVLGDNSDLEIFKVGKLAIATNHFDEANKLGEGGFGSVYKGILTDGQEIAVKRLSKSSGQGLEEFKNEVLVISKLQHRNLVRLLGCCIEGEEKILIYEYMPNKSLDAFLFDRVKRALLDWPKRYRIIEGVSRGILYLHRDSRLKVIHRDLKASNILLDEDLNPKISDFGMARIFGSDELQAKTRRVVGTYGYMSPEYAMEGRFSEKSDVFSFGVLLLEIVSGKKNNNFDHEELALSLLGYAWNLWNENKIPSLIDPTILSQPCFEQEILRCIHVGLLCVQEFAKDRPTMPTILSMLTSEIAVLPPPKQPAFFEGLISSESSSLTNNPKMYSVNTITMTTVEGR